MKSLKHLVAAACFSLAAMFAPAAQALPVALELVLLVDVSGSIDDAEYAIQKNGYVAAFQSAGLQALIAARQPSGGIAVTYVEWSGAAQQSTQVGWMQLTDAASSNAFAAAIASSTRAFSGQTAPGSAINYGIGLHNADNGFEGDRFVMDVSGDGTQNQGADTATARNAAQALGITINGLTIGNAALQAWYTANVKTASGFVIGVDNFADFQPAVEQKIGREITQVPEPGTLALLGLAGLGLGFARRRKI